MAENNEGTTPASDKNTPRKKVLKATAPNVVMTTAQFNKLISKLDGLGEKIGSNEKAAGTWVTKHWWASGAIVALILGVVIWSMSSGLQSAKADKQTWKDSVYTLNSERVKSEVNNKRLIDSLRNIVYGSERPNADAQKKN